MSIVRELKFAERVTRSGRDLEDQDVAEFEFKKHQSRKRLVLISFEDGSVLGDETGEESKWQTTKSQHYARAENHGRGDGASWRVVELCGDVTPSGWHSAGFVRLTARVNRLLKNSVFQESAG